MARADLIIKLVEAATESNDSLMEQTVTALIAEERAKQHHILADRLEKSLAKPRRTKKPPRAVRSTAAPEVLLEVAPERALKEIVLRPAARAQCEELIEEQSRADLLRSHNLDPRHRALFVGPPGNGKTSLAEALAFELAVPLFVIRYETIIGSYLGETAVALERAFDFVRSRPCVLFFDEFDTIGKERADAQETGEIKRVVSSLLLQIDRVPSWVVVVSATNHGELLDRATWRRFQLRIELPPPTRSQVTEWFEQFSDSLDLDLGYAARTLANKLHGLSFAELEEFCSDIRRRAILDAPDTHGPHIVKQRLAHWQSRATAD